MQNTINSKIFGTKKFNDLFKDVLNSFTGVYRVTVEGVKEMENVITEYEETIPTYKEDRLNLRKDSEKIIFDFRKALDEKNSQLAK